MKSLTIIIPTYNRKEYLDDNLSQLFELRNKVKFNLIVCDNGSNDGTRDVLRNWRERIEDLLVIEHDYNRGYDYNVASGYRNVKTDYCWVIGDSYRVDYSILSKVISIINCNDIDALIIKTSELQSNVKKKYVDINDLIIEQGWALTNLTGSIIRSDFASESNIVHCGDTYFLHFGLLFEGLALKKKINVVYNPDIIIGRKVLEIDKNAKSGGWRLTPFTVFGLNWTKIVMSLPNTITIESKLKCIKDHNSKTHLFDPLHIFVYKLCGMVLKKDYYNSRSVMHLVTCHPIWIYDIIMHVPTMPRFIIDLIQRYRKYRINRNV